MLSSCSQKSFMKEERAVPALTELERSFHLPLLGNINVHVRKWLWEDLIGRSLFVFFILAHSYHLCLSC